MTMHIFTGGQVLDPRLGVALPGIEVLVEDDRIKEVSDRPIKSASANRVDLAGRVLMPGLIDCHAHVMLTQYNVVSNAMAPSSLATIRSLPIMAAMLGRGFTTVRDACGADHGLVVAQQLGLISGPRLLISGKALSPTGGHGDFRERSNDRDFSFSERAGAIARIVDGTDNVRLAVRQEIKGGSTFIKVMANGGVASPNDPIHALGYSRDELRAIVEEAENAGIYVAAHLYADHAIRRAVECGVRSLEHCNLIQPETAALAAKAGAIAVPTLAIFEAVELEDSGVERSQEIVEKLRMVREQGLRSLEIMRDAGLPMAFGCDVYGHYHKYQCLEWEVRARVLSPAEIIRSATTIAAQLCRMEGQIGVIEPGAYADLLVIDGNPLEDIRLLQDDGANIAAIMQAGAFVKNVI